MYQHPDAVQNSNGINQKLGSSSMESSIASVCVCVCVVKELVTLLLYLWVLQV